MENRFYPFINEPLPYAYDALEPFIDEQTMRLHHDRHLQTYIDHLNDALKRAPRLQALPLVQLIQRAGSLPQPLQTDIRNNAGGVYNHRFFFEGLKRSAERRPRGRLLEEIDRQFGDFAGFLSAFQKAALSVFGSGYAWLVRGRRGLRILTTPNQNCPVEQGLCPVLTIDVWEHAYYLKHYNVRAGYVEDFLNLVDWDQAERNFLCGPFPPCRRV